jgi:hypothetical protein
MLTVQVASTNADAGAQAYLAAQPGIEGEILGQQAAISLGRQIFGTLLGSAL